jgi:hypothetical protein
LKFLPPFADDLPPFQSGRHVVQKVPVWYINELRKNIDGRQRYEEVRRMLSKESAGSQRGHKGMKEEVRRRKKNILPVEIEFGVEVDGRVGLLVGLLQRIVQHSLRKFRDSP